jgi:outer membrane receptor protein involved in Fe transport
MGDVEMENAWGAELRQDRIGTVGLYHTAARERLETTREDAVRQTSYSAWIRNTIQWAPKLRTVAGLRADTFRFDVASSLAANSGSASDGIVNPKLSVVLGPFAASELFVNLGGGFHSNDARGATLRVDPSTGDGADKVKPLVRARGAEIGWRTRLTPAWQAVLTIWRLDLASELVFVGDAGTTEASRPSVRSGAEWSHYWRPVKGLIVDADLAFSRARFRGGDPAGDRIPGAIERTASAGITYADGRWAGGLRLRYFGPRPLTEDGSVRSASSMLANLRLGYHFTPRLNLALDVLNALDRRTSDIDYYYASRLAGEAAPVAGIHTHPAEPRTLRATLTLSF